MQGIVITHRPKKGEFSNDLRLITMTKPEPRKNDVLIKVLYASVGVDDIYIAKGTALGGIPVGPTPSSNKPYIPGIELSGIVEKIGTNVTKFKVGDSVFGTPGFPIRREGAWAEYCCSKERYLMPETRLSHSF